ncbi:MAG: DUF554 domain-containing protein [Bacteroidales bacterium]|nr:MAG: DUF554 domain-containing protein [Bacteroidales bacterium]
MTGTLVNFGAIIVGGAIGLKFKSFLPQRVIDLLFQVFGLFTLYLGFSMALKTQNAILIAFSLILGALTGSILNLQDKTDRLGELIKRKFNLKGDRFTEGFIVASLMFCMGPVAILGSIEEGIGHEPKLLLIKSLMDGIASIALASSLGIGVIFSALPILIYQGFLTLLTMWLGGSFSEVMIDEISALGGILLIGMGINLLDIKKIKVIDFITALIYIVPLVYFF